MFTKPLPDLKIFPDQATRVKLSPVYILVYLSVEFHLKYFFLVANIIFWAPSHVLRPDEVLWWKKKNFNKSKVSLELQFYVRSTIMSIYHLYNASMLPHTRIESLSVPYESRSLRVGRHSSKTSAFGNVRYNNVGDVH